MERERERYLVGLCCLVHQLIGPRKCPTGQRLAGRDAARRGVRRGLQRPKKKKKRERCIYIYIYMSPIPFGLMRLGFLSSIMKTQANFVYGTLIYTYTSRHEFTNYTLIFNI